MNLKIVLSPKIYKECYTQAIQTLKLILVVMGTKGASKAKGIFFGMQYRCEYSTKYKRLFLY